MTRIDGILFDKDGTLFDFDATWSTWANRMIDDLSGGDSALGQALAERVGFLRATGSFRKDSPVIAGTPQEVAALVAPLLEVTPRDLIDRMNSEAAAAPMAEAVPLGPLLADLRARGLALGVATNDGEAPARAHLAGVGVTEAFDFIVGSDSGFGGKPHPGMCLAFAETLGLDPKRVAMVGDSLHDLMAARAAGMVAVAVLTGLAEDADLAPHAEVVLPDVGHLPRWLDSF